MMSFTLGAMKELLCNNSFCWLHWFLVNSFAFGLTKTVIPNLRKVSVAQFCA